MSKPKQQMNTSWFEFLLRHFIKKQLQIDPSAFQLDANQQAKGLVGKT